MQAAIITEIQFEITRKYVELHIHINLVKSELKLIIGGV